MAQNCGSARLLTDLSVLFYFFLILLPKLSSSNTDVRNQCSHRRHICDFDLETKFPS
jgi:hypothetical protein